MNADNFVGMMRPNGYEMHPSLTTVIDRILERVRERTQRFGFAIPRSERTRLVSRVIQ
jgi:hypothetical protein